MPSQTQRAWAEIDLGAISRNFRKFRQGPRGRAIIPVVKADAYGHGAVEVSRRLVKEGAAMFAVASLAEGRQLREAGIEVPILLLGSYNKTDCPEILEFGLTPSVSSVAFAIEFDKAARKRGPKATIHIEIDTGMGRLGIPVWKAIEEIEKISVLPNLELEGIYTHFAESEAEDKAFTTHQIDEFRRVNAALAGRGVRFRYHHTANSAACLDLPESLFDCLRPGLALYGIPPGPVCGRDAGLEPALEFRARVVHIEKYPAGHTIGYGRTHRLKKDSRVGVLSVGYGDGYDRRLSNRAAVTIRGKRGPVLGRVSMDLTSVDVSAVSGARVGDEAVLFSADPTADNCVDRLAALIGTIPYVLTCGISRRVTRVYKN